MNYLRTGTSLVLCVLLGLRAGQYGAQQPPATGGVIRIDVNLVQVDAVVTDLKGKAVTNLTRDDFEILQDGQPQKITAFEFVEVKNRAAMLDDLRLEVVPRSPLVGVPPPPRHTMLKREDIRRTIALVVDDLALSFDSVVRVREALKKWVTYEMQEGDLVALIRTSAGMGSLQRFTMEKQVLSTAIDLIRYQPGKIGVSSFASATGAPPPVVDPVTGEVVVDPETGQILRDAIDRSVFEDELEHAYTVGSLGAIQYVIRGLHDLPGRKSLILFSESMKFTYLEGSTMVRSFSQTNATSDARIRKLADEASRSSVVIYAIDPRGVINTALSAEDNLSGMTVQEMNQITSDRSQRLIESRDGMIELSQKTGGLFVHDDNDMTRALRKAVDDGDGYYLLGYQPDLFTFEQSRKSAFHSIKVRVKNPDLTVRSRTGFYGKADADRAVPATRRTQITSALASPFASDDLRVRLTGLFSPGDKGTSSVEAMLHIDARDLTFSDEPDGTRKAGGEIVAVTFDGEGEQVDTMARSWTVTIPGEIFDKVLTAGLIYTATVPVKKPGGYQLRAVVRDSGSQKIGSAMQFIEVPDVKKNRLTLSGIVMGATLPKSGDENSGATLDRTKVEGTPAVRIFRSGAVIQYAYKVLNATLDVDKEPQLESVLRLFKDGKIVYSGRSSAIASTPVKNSKQLVVAGQFQLNQIPAGDYTMQLIVEDSLRHDKYRLAAQAIDFQIRN
jgi:VWFA-related protein